jgi:uncharacterized membrane protein
VAPNVNSTARGLGRVTSCSESSLWSWWFWSCTSLALGCTAIDHREDSMTQNHYRHLLIMAALSFASMYVLMYAMVDTPDNVFANFNQISIQDPEIKRLCSTIIAGQRAEIDQMRTKLRQLED